MKLKSLLLAFSALCLTVSVRADVVVAGPKGGRLLDAPPLTAEFFVNVDHHVEITFYDATLQPVDPGAQTVAVIAEPRSGRVPLEMSRTPTGFVSKAALPDAAPYRVVVQLREREGDRPKNFRIDLNLALCGECQKAEYACVCGH